MEIFFGLMTLKKAELARQLPTPLMRFKVQLLKITTTIEYTSYCINAMGH